jgi:hypothetical protein
LVPTANDIDLVDPPITPCSILRYIRWDPFDCGPMAPRWTRLPDRPPVSPQPVRRSRFPVWRWRNSPTPRF